MFRAYDIRGVAGKDLTPKVAELLGLAYATYLHRTYGVRQIVAGRDARHSSESLFAAFTGGVTAAGTDVIDIGLSPSPLLYFAAAHWGIDGGVNVTASHNPAHMNGMKLLERGGLPLSPDEIQAIRQLADCGDFSRGVGRVEPRDPKPEYLAFLADQFGLGRDLRIVTDAGNGVAALTGPAALRQAGANVFELYSELDGSFPNHAPDPQVLQNMADLGATVRTSGADLGIAWDGDGDRLGIVDEMGVPYEADKLLAVFARDLLARRPGERIFVDVKISWTAIRTIEAAGGVVVMGPTGHSLAKREMRRTGILFGGEASAHFYFNDDYYGLDDAVYGACAFADLLARHGGPASTLFADLPRFQTSSELRLPCSDAEKVQIAADVGAEFSASHPVLSVDGSRIDFGAGWALIRPSNTEAVVSVRVEAETTEAFDAIRTQLVDALRRRGVDPQVLIDAHTLP